ncbi:hypothetical protein [Methanosarcina sp. UBA5]|uniref:hypothetical protein n=1 Tax=Methanosarcina sp. UBA5 TaxID=1915593 RepID=UPI0025F9BBC7|nr:hypothetical protein [Methanosarcina sp. UBA5]
MKEQTTGQTINISKQELAEDSGKGAVIRNAEITVYSDNLALIKEKRKLDLKSDAFDLAGQLSQIDLFTVK